MSSFSSLLSTGIAVALLAAVAPALVNAAQAPASGGVASAPTTSAPDAVHLSGTILLPNGKAASDATATLYVIDPQANALLQSISAKADAAGAFGLDWVRPGKPAIVALCATSPEGVALDTTNRGRSRTQVLTLRPTTTVRVRLLGTDGKPAAGVRLSPGFFFDDGGGGASWGAFSHPWTQVTDADGTATITGLPQGYTMRLHVADDRFTEPQMKDDVHLATHAETPDQTIHLSLAGGIAGTVSYGPDGRPAAGVRVEAQPLGNGEGYGSVTTDAGGHYRMDRMPAGSFVIAIVESAPGSEGWTAIARSTLVEAGSVVRGQDLTLIRGGVLAGRVTDRKTGKPIARQAVLINGPSHPSGSRSTAIVYTDRDGRYTLHVPPGKQTAYTYTVPTVGDRYHPKTITVADGQTATLDFQLDPPVALKPVHGTVLSTDGSPAAGAEVVVVSSEPSRRKTTTDAQGRFAFDEPGLTPDCRLYSRLGNQATMGGVTPGTQDPITIRLKAGVLCIPRGRVTDQDGRPLAGAKVSLVRWNEHNTGWDVDSATTDARGAYVFGANYADVGYSVRVARAGYAQEYSKTVRATAGCPVDLPIVKLMIADSFVAGTVVDPKGNPVAGAEVRDPGHFDRSVITDRNGHFRLDGVRRGSANVMVRAPEDRFASIQVPTGLGDNVITVMSRAEQEEQGKRFVAIRDADPTNHGNGEDANALLKSALARAGASGKRVFLVFHASWCGPCFVLHRFLHDPAVRHIVDAHFVVQEIDIWEEGDKKVKWENRGGDALRVRYDGPRSVPYFVVLDATGKKIGDSKRNGENYGAPVGADSQQSFFAMLKKAVPKLTNADMSAMKAGLLRASTF